MAEICVKDAEIEKNLDKNFKDAEIEKNLDKNFQVTNREQQERNRISRDTVHSKRLNQWLLWGVS